MRARIFYTTKQAFEELPHGTFFFTGQKTKDILDESGLKYFVEVDEFESNGKFESNNHFAEYLFCIYNGGHEIENPLATKEGQDKIKSLGASHTSMSINDFVVIDDEVFVVDNVGFLNIGKHSAVKEVIQS